MNKKNDLQTSNAEMVTISRAEYEEFQAQKKKISELENRVDMLMEALRLARHKQFGASSEKSDDTLMEQLSFLFDEAEVFSAADKEDENVTVVTAHKRHKKHEYALESIPEGIPTKQVEHCLEGDDLVCPQCGDTMTEIGKEVVRTLEIIPAQMVVREDIYYTYACQACNKDNTETPVVKAPKEKSIIPGSFATPEAIAHIMTQKFVMGSPLYRQEQEMNRKGIHLSRQTMSNWILKATEDYLVPVYRYLHRELLTRDVLHADETTLQVLHESGKKPQSDSYMWLYRTSGDTDKPI
ncbi:MAG: transposase, partial [Oscillospiraceae bacterium]|nr:transposase [Oscillospiraceae bacterium]